MAPRRPPPPEVSTPPVIPWREWYAREAAILGEAASQGEGFHILFDGPTRSGKTLLCRKVARLRPAVVVWGTKPKDKSLDAYVDEGYCRIDHWPPTNREIRDQPEGQARFIIWPEMHKREDLRRYRGVYLNCIESIFIEGKWVLVVDEGLWTASRTGLDLQRQVDDYAYTGAGNMNSLFVLAQRQANVGPITWTSVMQALLFHQGRADDVAEVASLGTVPPKDARVAIQKLRGHAFLDLPCRGGAEWAISEVQL